MSDLRPSEYLDIITGPEDKKSIESFNRDGIKDSIRIKPNGDIIRGNTRYFWNIKNLNDLYLPIDLGYYLGLNINKDGSVSMRREVFQNEAMRKWNTEFESSKRLVRIRCKHVHPPNTNDKYPIPLRGGGHKIVIHGADLHELVYFDSVYPNWILRGLKKHEKT